MMSSAANWMRPNQSIIERNMKCVNVYGNMQRMKRMLLDKFERSYNVSDVRLDR